MIDSPAALLAGNAQLPTVLFAQQPILNADQVVVAAELLFRGDFETTSGEAATATVLCNALAQDWFTERTEQPLFLNFTATLLADPPPLPRAALVIELLESIEPTAEVIEQVQRLKQDGFQIALDDYVDSPAMTPLLELADIVKVEVMGVAEVTLRALVDRLRPFGVRLLAEKVETHEEFELCQQLGFELFQGFFFARPKLVEGHRLGPGKAAVLELLSTLQDPSLNPERLEAVVLGDAGLTFKTLQLVNSAENRRATEITTIRHAISMLGLEKIRTFASLLALSGLDDKPRELQHYAQIRTGLCQVLCRRMKTEVPLEVFQTAGMLSTCPAYFDLEITAIVDTLPLSAELRAALVEGSGDVGLVIRTAQHLQEGQVQRVDWVALSERAFDLEPAAEEINEILLGIRTPAVS